MKNITKRIIAVMAVLCVATAGFAGCEKKQKDDTNGTVSEADMKFPLQFGEAGDGNPFTSGSDDLDLDAEDPTKPADAEPATEEVTEVQDATDADGQPVTEVQEVTDADGAKVTEEGGAPATTVVNVTTIVKNTVTVAQTKPTEAAYKAKNDRRYAMWLDVSKDENFYFEGDFLKATFKIKEGIPDGDYKIRLTTDLSDVAGKVVDADKVIDGIVRVNNGAIDKVDVSSESGLVFYCDNVACKQGDTIDYYFYVKNNPGLAAFCCWFYFDSNAMEFIEADSSGKFDEIARNTEIGAGKYNNDN